MDFSKRDIQAKRNANFEYEKFVLIVVFSCVPGCCSNRPDIFRKNISKRNICNSMKMIKIDEFISVHLQVKCSTFQLRSFCFIKKMAFVLKKEFSCTIRI